MMRPVMSTMVVINGPAATAGSSLIFRKRRGKSVPEIVAKMIIATKVKPTVRLKRGFFCIQKALAIPKIPIIDPKTKPAKISLLNILKVWRRENSPVANPLMTTVADCVPALPAVSISIGMKKARAITASKA